MNDDLPSPSDSSQPSPTQQMRDLLLGPSTTPEKKTAWVPPTVEAVQAMLPGYTVEKFVARGGMGAVYRGRQKSLGRLVAIKILPAELQIADENYAERFRQEARAMGQLNHPGIVAVHDSGEMPDGTLYFVMEFIEGTDVAQMVAAQGRLPSAHAMAICAHVCDALQYAHEHGVVHRDIKPANIMVGYDGRVKVADFGLAKTNVAGEANLTRSGMVMGTLHFMAPEAHTLGSAVDQRADIYAVGVMLYQMLTGKLPQGMFEMPSMQVPGLDPRYDAIIAQALRESRELRYQQISEMRLALDGILTQPVAKVKAQPADAKAEVPAALPTNARPQRSAHQPYRPPQPQVVVKYEKKGSPLVWIGVITLGAVAAWMYWDRQNTRDSTEAVVVDSTSKLPASVGTEVKSPTTGIKIDDAFMKANVLGTSWRTHYTNDSRYDTLEFKSAGNEVVKKASVGGQQQAIWSIEEGGVALKVTTLDTSGFHFLINFTSNNTADIQFIKVKTISMVGILSRIAIAKPVPSSPVTTAGAISATKDAPFVNTLGMKFVPVPGTKVLFCIHETRVKDYATYAAANKVDASWTTQMRDGVPISREPEYPVCGVSMDDGSAFCRWLTEREGAGSKLPHEMKYRLPTDEEWSRAVGLTKEEGAMPKEKHGMNKVDFPWGLGYPPPATAGNFRDAASHEKFPQGSWLEGYTDGFSTTAPVARFAPNQFGIYDLAGNVMEWCQDLYETGSSDRVLRGSSWEDFESGKLLSSRRYHDAPNFRFSRYGTSGFRCVLELGTQPAQMATAPFVLPLPPQPSAAALNTGSATWTDTKGRSITAKFKGIQGDNVLLEIAGKVTPVPMNTLSEASQKQARDYEQTKPSVTQDGNPPQASSTIPRPPKLKIGPSPALALAKQKGGTIKITGHFGARSKLAPVDASSLASFNDFVELDSTASKIVARRASGRAHSIFVEDGVTKTMEFPGIIRLFKSLNWPRMGSTDSVFHELTRHSLYLKPAHEPVSVASCYDDWNGVFVLYANGQSDWYSPRDSVDSPVSGGNYKLPPADMTTTVYAAAGMDTHVVFLNRDGTMFGWNLSEGTALSFGPNLKSVVEIDGGGRFVVALKSDGSVWELRGAGNTKPAPDGAGPFVAVRAFGAGFAAQRPDGTWKSWSTNPEIDLQVSKLGFVIDLDVGWSSQKEREEDFLVWIDL